MRKALKKTIPKREYATAFRAPLGACYDVVGEHADAAEEEFVEKADEDEKYGIVLRMAKDINIKGEERVHRDETRESEAVFPRLARDDHLRRFLGLGLYAFNWRMKVQEHGVGRKTPAVRGYRTTMASEPTF